MAKGGFPGGMNMQNMMRQARQMQAKMQQMQAEDGEREVERPPAAAWYVLLRAGKNS